MQNAPTPIQRLTQVAKKLRGFVFTVPAGNSTQNITLQGNARMLLGLRVYQEAYTTSNQISLNINQEIILDGVDAAFLGAQNFTGDEYFKIERILTGQDTIELNFNSVGSQETRVLFIYR